MSVRLFSQPCRNLYCFFPKQRVASRLVGFPERAISSRRRSMSNDSNQKKTSETGNVAEQIEEATDSSKELTGRQKLRRIFAEYGVTAVVFHTGISLTSLGLCYVAVNSGLDIPGFLIKIGVSENLSQSVAAKGASTFVIAYACHKVFMPLRIFLTVTCTPLIVHRFRRLGLMK